MAGATSSSSSSSSSEDYDVFLSFRGEDTRRNFVSHLYTALLQKQIKAYKDDETLEKGDEIGPALVRAIKKSYLCIVVFSKGYASSTWCLKELTQILDCKQEGEYIPLFYEIDPSHVRKQTGSYKDAFEEHEKNPKLGEETVSKWKASLEKAANFSGWDSRSQKYSDDSNFIDEIVKKVLQKLSCKYPPNELPGLIGIKKNIRSIESLLKKVQTIGIWGMGGIGKTTLARAVFEKLSRQYDGGYFLANVREESRKHGPDDLRKKLLSKLLDGKDIPEGETSFAIHRLKRKKVFIVLDDVDDPKQLQQLIGGYDCLRSDSRLIVTTRNKHVIDRERVIGEGVPKIYKVRTLQLTESIELFSMNAFKHNHPKIGFEELTRKAVAYAGGIPLALKVLGSSLCSKEREVWESALKKLESHPNMEIQDVLRWSYNRLEDIEKKIFLDIACFLKGEHKNSVISILDACDFFAAAGIETLLDRALVTINFDGCIEMHDLIEQMGKEIVREEATNECGKRSRLWDPKEICDVLQYNKESNLIEGIILDMSKSGDLHLNADSFTKMSNLRYLNFYEHWDENSCTVYIPSHTKLIFGKLSYFRWDGWPLQSLPSTFCSEKLVELHMPYSHVEKLWNGVQDTVNLRIINLRQSKRLIEFPNLSNSSNLDSIDLGSCENLRSVDLSNLCLPKLNYLNLSCCQKLESLLSETPLKSLEHLNVHGCSSLKEFSLSSKEIMVLDLRETAMEILPLSIGKCSKLESLYLPVSLKNLPNELSNLRSLQNLSIQYCSRLQHLAKLPLSIQRLEANNCENLRHVDLSISCLPLLVDLDLSCCPKLESLLSETPLKSLKHLNVHGCSSLKEFSLSSKEIMVLDLRKTAIEILSSSIGKCSKLESLYLPASLKKLPNELSNLRSLRNLDLGNSRELDTGNLHIILDGLQSLDGLTWSGCYNLSHFPNSLGALSRLKILTLDGSNVESLPASITNLSQLRTLSVQNCSRLQHLPELPATIHLLKAKNCTSLKTVSILMELKFASLQMDFLNCVKLDLFLMQAYLDFIIKQREASEFHFFFPPRFEACFPGKKIPRCFLYRATQRWTTIEIPLCFDLKGFTFCIIISPGIMPLDSEGFIISSECHFVNGETVKFQYIHKPDPNEVHFDPGIVHIISEHAYLWYENYYFIGKLNRTKEKANNMCTNFSQKIFIEFSFYVTKGTKTMKMNQMIKECGVWPIFNKKEHNLDLNMDIETKGCWDINDQCRKKFKAFQLELELGNKSYSYQDIDEPKSSIIEIGVDGTGFDHVYPDELQMQAQRKELKEFIFQPLSTDC